MVAGLLADLVVLLHAAFIVFAALGAFFVLRWPRLAWLHLPAVAWAMLISFFGWPCPLTPLEKWLRAQAGEAAYGGGFIDHYVSQIVYPPGLTRETQVLLGTLLLVGNVLLYGLALRRRRRRRTGVESARDRAGAASTDGGSEG